MILSPSYCTVSSGCLQGTNNCVCTQRPLNLICCECRIGTTPSRMKCIAGKNITTRNGELFTASLAPAPTSTHTRPRNSMRSRQRGRMPSRQRGRRHARNLRLRHVSRPEQLAMGQEVVTEEGRHTTGELRILSCRDTFVTRIMATMPLVGTGFKRHQQMN